MDFHLNARIRYMHSAHFYAEKDNYEINKFVSPARAGLYTAHTHTHTRTCVMFCRMV